MSSPKYVSYYDCTGWNSSVEVMNLQGFLAEFRITVFDRSGANVWSVIRAPAAHETQRITIDSFAPKCEGLVVVEPVVEGYEFPSWLTINDQGRDWKVANRFVPFIRVP